jgi:hypothetical protein
MEKKKIKVSYEGSGVKTLGGFSVFFFIVGGIALLVAVIGGIVYLTNTDSYRNEGTALAGAASFGTFFPIGIASLCAGAVCAGLSNIAKTALYKRAILREKYDFAESRHEEYSKTIDSGKQKFPRYTWAIVKATGKRVEIHGFDSGTMKYNCTSNNGFSYKSYTEDELEPE